MRGNVQELISVSDRVEAEFKARDGIWQVGVIATRARRAQQRRFVDTAGGVRRWSGRSIRGGYDEAARRWHLHGSTRISLVVVSHIEMHVDLMQCERGGHLT